LVNYARYLLVLEIGYYQTGGGDGARRILPPAMLIGKSLTLPLD